MALSSAYRPQTGKCLIEAYSGATFYAVFESSTMGEEAWSSCTRRTSLRNECRRDVCAGQPLVPGYPVLRMPAAIPLMVTSSASARGGSTSAVLLARARRSSSACSRFSGST
jgi:hypothetical protein